MRRFGAWVAFLLLTLYLVFIGGAWLGIYNVQLSQITSLLLRRGLRRMGASRGGTLPGGRAARSRRQSS